MSRVALTDDLQADLVRLLELGLSVERACEAAGIAPVTYRAWRSRKGARYLAFHEATDAARANGEATLVRKIVAQTGKSWRAAAWLLEHAHGWGKAPAMARPPAVEDDPLAGIIDLDRRRHAG